MNKNEKEQYYAIGFRWDENTRTCVSLYEQRELSLDEYHPLENSIQESYRILCDTEDFAGLRNPNSASPVKAEPYHTYKLCSVIGDIINDCELDGFSYDIKRKNVIYGVTYIYAQKCDNLYYDVITGDEIPKEVIGTVDEILDVSDIEEMIDDLKFIKEHKENYVRILDDIISKMLLGYINYRSALVAFKKRYDAYEQEMRRYLQAQKENNTLTDFNDEVLLDGKLEEVKKLILEIKKDSKN